MAFMKSILKLPAAFALYGLVTGPNVNAQTAADAARAAPLTIAGQSAFALYDGTLKVPNDGSFVLDVPTEQVADVLKSGGADPQTFVLDIQPLAVKMRGHILLFDTGGGTFYGKDAGVLRASLAKAGVDPKDVTDIFITHTHGDHIGGLITPAGAPAFPNAKVYIAQPEWDWLRSISANAARNYGIQDHASVIAALTSRVVPFAPGAKLMGGSVTAIPIAGHTPGHSGYRIGKGAKSVMFVGDSMHHFVSSVSHPEWRVAYDVDKSQASTSRQTFVRQWARHGQTVYAEHFPFPGLGRIVIRGEGFAWSPAD